MELSSTSEHRKATSDYELEILTVRSWLARSAGRTGACDYTDMQSSWPSRTKKSSENPQNNLVHQSISKIKGVTLRRIG